MPPRETGRSPRPDPRRRRRPGTAHTRDRRTNIRTGHSICERPRRPNANILGAAAGATSIGSLFSRSVKFRSHHVPSAYVALWGGSFRLLTSGVRGTAALCMKRGKQFRGMLSHATYKARVSSLTRSLVPTVASVAFTATGTTVTSSPGQFAVQNGVIDAKSSFAKQSYLTVMPVSRSLWTHPTETWEPASMQERVNLLSCANESSHSV